MKQFWILVLSLLIATALFANGVTASPKATMGKNSRYEVLAYSENFETGGTGWTHYDGAVSPNNWHIYDNSAPQGNVWWMGDPALASGANIGGYYDHQYLVMDTPNILVPTASPTLTFKLRYAVESPGGEDPGWNGWDACNVRISSNNGETWSVISGTPAYTVTSAFSFGSIHGEGQNIAAWGGTNAAWQNASFSLAAYAGQNVKIRFAIASDDAFSTGDDPTLFGMMVDDIALGAYSNNGTNDGQMTWTSMVPLGGDLWHLGVVTDAPSPTHVAINQNAQGTYNVNMLNYFVSPPYVLPESGDIRCDFMVKGNFTDPNTFPQVDYWGWELSINNGVTWFAMSNPYGSATGSNYVYSDAPAEWSSMTGSYSLDGYISDYAGETAIFRWYFQSDADTPAGTGIMIDDFKIYNDIFLAEPANLTAAVLGNTVSLNWTTPGGGGEPGWLTYATEANSSSIGLVSAGNMEVAAKWAPAGANSILPYVGMNITSVKFWPAQAGLTYTVHVYTGAAGNTVYSQVVSNPTIDAWNEVVLTTPFAIPSGTYVWVGYSCTQLAGQFPAGIDAGPAVAGFGDMYRSGSSWSSLYNASAGANDGNWNIQAYVTDAAGRAAMITPPPPRNDREITAYKVYRDDAFLAEVAAALTSYQDLNVAGGLHSYKVTAMYGVNESLASNIVPAYVLPDNYDELGYDDSSSELGYNVGSTNMMAVKFEHNYESTLKYVKVFVTNVGTSPMIIRVFDNNGVDGMPGATHLTQFTYASTSIVEGWNYIPVPAGSDLTIADGSFYIAILEYTNSSAIGFDTSQFGHSFKKTAAGWEALTNGEALLHCIVENGVGSEDPIVTPIVFSTNNYPNPFSPETSISYNVPKDGQTALTIYNTKGQIVRSLLNSNVKAGSYKVTWNGKDNLGNNVANGVYFYRLESNQKIITKKMLLSK